MVPADSTHFALTRLQRLIVDSLTHGVDLIVHVDVAEGDPITLLLDDRASVDFDYHVAPGDGRDGELVRADSLHRAVGGHRLAGVIAAVRILQHDHDGGFVVPAYLCCDVNAIADVETGRVQRLISLADDRVGGDLRRHVY